MKHWLYKSGWRLLPGLMAAGVTLLAARLGIVQSLEQTVYRTLFSVRGEQPWDERVAVIEIDEASLAAIGQFPWPRHYYTDLLEQLTPASVIAFDILFAESSEDDAALAKAMDRHGEVVLATAWDEQRGVIGPNAMVVEGAIATGHIHNHGDVDEITRAYQPKINGTLALSMLAVQRYSQQQSVYASLSVRDIDQPLWLNWPGFAHHAPRYSFVDVLTGKVPGTIFTDKIVFIGFTGVGLDVVATPYNQNPPAAGVYQHVVAANNLLSQNHLQPIVLPVWILFALLSSLVGYGFCYRRLRIQLLVSLTIVFVWGSLVLVAFSYSYWLPTVMPTLSIALTSMLARFTERLKTRLQLLQWVDEIRPVSLRLHPSLKTNRY
ncbi:CHASE2 domain-containing protein [Leptothoe spongobia]|nr:CHASE2 domain-containing protein [Leptothoe spongobia]